jgi:hypothetical protein
MMLYVCLVYVVDGKEYHRGRSIGKGAYAKVYALYTRPYDDNVLLATKVFDKRTVLGTLLLFRVSA